MLLDLFSLEYGVGSSVDAHDGYTRKDYEKHLERLRRRELRLEQSRAQKLAQRDLLRDQVRSTVNQEIIDNNDRSIPIVAATESKIIAVDNRLLLVEKQIAKIKQELSIYNMKYQEQVRINRMKNDEEAILLLM